MAGQERLFCKCKHAGDLAEGRGELSGEQLERLPVTKGAALTTGKGCPADHER